MKGLLTILCLVSVIQLYGQFEAFPIYRLIDIDSIQPGDYHHIKTINVKNDAVKIDIDGKNYSFISSGSDSNSNHRYPTFIAGYDHKFNLEIRSWEIVEIASGYVTFRLAYTKRNKENGSQKGKYYNIDNYRIEKDKITGVYAGHLNKEQNKKLNLINLGFAGAVILITALIIGTR